MGYAQGGWILVHGEGEFCCKDGQSKTAHLVLCYCGHCLAHRVHRRTKNQKIAEMAESKQSTRCPSDAVAVTPLHTYLRSCYGAGKYAVLVCGHVEDAMEERCG